MIRRAASSSSSALVVAPKLKRMAEFSRSSAMPMAFRTGEGSSEPLEQAEPVEHATPADEHAVDLEPDCILVPGAQVVKLIERLFHRFFSGGASGHTLRRLHQWQCSPAVRGGSIPSSS